MTPRAASSAAANVSTRPAKATVRTPCAAASRATPSTVFPVSVCASRLPSPVKHHCAPSRASRSPRSSATISTPGRNSAFAKASSPKPSPPAAPAPGTARRSRPSSSAATLAKWSSASSSWATAAASAPFCGPKIALAPFGPVKRTRDVGCDFDARACDAWIQASQVDAREAYERRSAGRQFALAAVEQTRAERLQQTGSAVVRRTAADADDDVPRSFVERGFDQLARTVTRRAKRIALFRDDTSCNPEAAAISTIAVEPAKANAASSGVPSGPRTIRATRRAPVAKKASTVPSPPSAIGTVRASSDEPNASSKPRSIAAAASSAVKLPLNLSGAMTARNQLCVIKMSWVMT